MGRNDLDPASTAVAQQWIQATAYYTLEGNGLAQDWRGRVWLNPPYGKQIGRWVDKTLNEYRQGNMNGHPVESTFEEHVRGGNYVEVGGKGWERAVNILIALASAGIGVLLFLLLG